MLQSGESLYWLQSYLLFSVILKTTHTNSQHTSTSIYEIR